MIYGSPEGRLLQHSCETFKNVVVHGELPQAVPENCWQMADFSDRMHFDLGIGVALLLCPPSYVDSASINQLLLPEGIVITSGHFPRFELDVPGRTILRLDPNHAYRGQMDRWVAISNLMKAAQPSSFGRAMTICKTITEIVARREREVFLVDANTAQEITYGEFHRQACAMAQELRARGVRKGDRIGVMLPNCCELAILYFACIYLGAVIVPVNPALSKNESEFILTSSKPVLVVASASSTESIREFHTNVVGLLTADEAIENSIASDKIRIGDLSEASRFRPSGNSRCR